MRGSRKFCQRGPIAFFFSVVDEGIEDPNVTLNVPSSPASETLFKWRFAGRSMMAQH